MRQALRKHIPSMFQRRLLMLLLLALAVAVVLLGRTAQLTLGQAHDRLRQEAERALRRTTYIPTIRGTIRDRAGRVLAVNRPGYDVAVSFDVLTGEWAFSQAAGQARREHAQLWPRLDAGQRERIIARFQELYDAQVEELFRTLGELGRDLSGVDGQELERRRNAIIAEVQQTWAQVTLRNQQRRLEQLDEPISWSEANMPVAEQKQKHTLLGDVDERVRTIVEGFIADAERAEAEGSPEAEALAVWRQVAVTRPKHRRYPLETWPELIAVDMTTMPPVLRRDQPVMVQVDGVALHVIGLMRDVFAEDTARKPFTPTYLDGYRPGDRVGASGIESAMEGVLRGRRGMSIRRLDVNREEVRIDPVPGRDVQLTLDAQLQAKLQALLSEEVGLTVVQAYHRSQAAERGEIGTPLNGAAVILDIHNSEVLAAVSFPGFSLRQLEQQPDAVYRDPARMPYMNRVVANKYNPGSTLKPIMLLSAVTAGRHALHDPILCDGVLDPAHPDRFRCWIFKTYGMRHGLLNAAQSLQHSCNIYYYTLGQRMGVERTVDWYGRFGLGRLTDCGLPEEVPGSLPDPAREGVNAAINMAIGQGPVAWTPLQAAAVYAAMARGGVYMPPTFIHDASRSRPRTDLHVNASAVADALEGLRRVVADPEGTAHWLDRPNHERIFNVEGVTIYGKSGTADVGRWIDWNMNNEPDPGELTSAEETDDHAWFVALVKPEGEPGPMYAIAVVTEYAGSGGRVSGPIVNQVIHLLRQEGWL